MLVVELLLGSRETEVGRVEPNAISYLIVPCSALSFIVLRLHSSCCFVQHLLRFLVDDGHFLCKVGGGRVREGSGSRGVGKDSGIPSVEHHERTLSGCTVNSVIMCKFSKREPVAPVHLSMIDKDL